jgi:hypothetical protein
MGQYVSYLYISRRAVTVSREVLHSVLVEFGTPVKLVN